MRNRIFFGRYVQCVVLLLSLALVGTVLTGPTFAYIVTQTSSLINTFISGLESEGGIIIRKTVAHPFGEAYAIPDHIAFDFRVELGEQYADKTVNTTRGSLTADSNGDIIVTVKPDESVGIHEITAGTTVTVTELQQYPGFTVADGNISQTVTVIARENTPVHFFNTYTPAPVPNVNLNVTGVKNLEGRPWQEGDTFTFRLDCRYLEDENSQWTQLGTASVTYDPDHEAFNRFDLTQLVQSVDYSRSGVYAFRVSETEGSIGGITYDELVGYFDVLVGDGDMDGYLELRQVTGTAGTEVVWDEARKTHYVTVTFSNRYAPNGSAAVSIPILKTVQDRSSQNKSAAGFTFELYTPEGQLVRTSEPTSAAGETGLRLVYDAAQAGQTFTYILKETGGGTVADAMIYDARSHTIHVSVTDNLDGTVSAQANVTGLNFVNIYDPQDATVQLTGTKTLDGRALREGEFAFDLYQADAGFLTADDAQPILTALNGGDGSFSFEPLVYSQVGTYYYVVREDASAALGGVSYDDTVYHLTVTVTDENGILTAQTAITGISGAPAELLYHNTYSPIAAVLRLGGTKVLEGAPLTQGQFHFKLFAANENFAPEGQAQQTAANTAQGDFSFEELTYEQEGTYRYIIREEIVKRLEDVIYDDTVYGVTVTVTDDGNGALVATTDIIRIGGNSTDEIVFENVYMPQQPEDPTEPDHPTKPEKPDVPKVPGTDHPESPGPYIVMFVLCTALLVMLLLWEKYGWRYK